MPGSIDSFVTSTPIYARKVPAKIEETCYGTRYQRRGTVLAIGLIALTAVLSVDWTANPIRWYPDAATRMLSGFATAAIVLIVAWRPFGSNRPR